MYYKSSSVMGEERLHFDKKSFMKLISRVETDKRKLTL